MAWDLVSTTEYGKLHLARRAAHAPVALVLIHGVLGNHDKSWRQVPTLIEEVSQSVVDVFSFSYPSGLAHRASIERGSADLREALRSSSLQNYQNLIFLVHSTGGLVLKMALVEDVKELLKNLEAGNSPEWIQTSLALRARQILNVAVPHSGASKSASSLLIPAYRILWPTFWIGGAFLRISRLVTRQPAERGFSLGYNSIIPDLKHLSPKLIELEREYQVRIAELEKRKLPRPVALEIHGTEDIAIHESAHEYRTELCTLPRFTSPMQGYGAIFRGSHPLVKDARSVHDALIVMVAKLLDRYRDGLSYVLADRTMFRSVQLDLAHSLVGTVDTKQDSMPA